MLSLSKCVFAVLALSVGIANAIACDYCTDKVVLTFDLAKCLQSRMPSELAKFDATKEPVILISLAACPGAKDDKRGGQSLPDDAPPADPPTLSLLLDRYQLVCLGELMKTEGINWTPAAIFELHAQCK